MTPAMRTALHGAVVYGLVQRHGRWHTDRPGGDKFAASTIEALRLNGWIAYDKGRIVISDRGRAALRRQWPVQS